MMSEEEKMKMQLLKEIFGNADIKAEQIVFGHGVYVQHAEHVDANGASDGSGERSSECPSQQQEAEEECPWIGEVLNSFYSDRKNALEFVSMVEHLKPVQVTALVNDWIKQGKISPMSAGRDLWRPLHVHGLYEPSESNWNHQIRR